MLKKKDHFSLKNINGNVLSTQKDNIINDNTVPNAKQQPMYKRKCILVYYNIHKQFDSNHCGLFLEL